MNPQFPNHPLLGIDVSKLTFDACLLLSDGGKASIELPNDPDGFTRLDTWLSQHGAARTLAGLEATGPYGVPLLWHLHSRGAPDRPAQSPARQRLCPQPRTPGQDRQD